MPSRLLAAVATMAFVALASANACHGQQGAAEPSVWRNMISVRGGTRLFDDEPEPLDSITGFFDEVTTEERLDPGGFEVMKQFALVGGDGANTWRTGWQAAVSFPDWSLAAGQEVAGVASVSESASEAVTWGAIRKALQQTRFTPYATGGLRYGEIKSGFYFLGTGSILGRTHVETITEQYFIGPQLGLGLAAETSMFRFEAGLLGLVGYGKADVSQWGVFGEESIPGALNRPATSRSTGTFNGYSYGDYVAWNGEVRLTASCQLTQSLRIDARWTGVSTGPVYNAYAATLWNAPDFGIAPVDGGTVDFDYWTFGLTYTR